MTHRKTIADPIMPASVQKRRCAVYTRKSTDEGLEKEFNTLDAQREACEAYIASQRAEGWVLVPHRYDDGGYLGGSLELPALQRLLRDIEADEATGGDDILRRISAAQIKGAVIGQVRALLRQPEIVAGGWLAARQDVAAIRFRGRAYCD